MASISPFWMAATAPAPAPTPMKEASSGFRPALAIRYWTIMLVEEPGAVTPILAPLRSAMVLILSVRSFLTASAMPGIAAELDDGHDVLALGLHAQRVLVGAGDDVDRAADQRGERLRAALEIVDLDVEPLLLEEAELLGERQRQVVERVAAADAELDVLLLRRLGAGAAGGQHHGCGDGDGLPELHAASP